VTQGGPADSTNPGLYRLRPGFSEAGDQLCLHHWSGAVPIRDGVQPWCASWQLVIGALPELPDGQQDGAVRSCLHCQNTMFEAWAG